MPQGTARSSPVRTAVVGLGWAARTIWLPLLSERPAFQVAAVADPDPVARAQALASTGSRAYADASELSPDDIDLAVVAVPNRLHAAIASTLLGRGIPVFLEKPLCLSSAEAALLADAECRGGAVLLAGSAARYRSDIAELSRLTGSLGTIRHLELSWIRARGIPEGRGWFTQRRLAGGGALIDLGWHLLDIGLPLLAAPQIRDVLGAMSADFLRQPAWRATWRGEELPSAVPAGDVENDARALLVTEDGVSIILRVCWASHWTLDTTQIVVEGTAGAARLDCTFGFSPNRRPHPSLTVFRQGQEEQVPLSEDPVGVEYARQVDALPGMLADPGMRGRAIAEAARTVGVIERLYQVAQSAPVAQSGPVAPSGPATVDDPASPTPAIVVAAEVRQLRLALADAASGRAFVLHVRIPAIGRPTVGAWSRIPAAVRLAMLGAVALSYGTGRRIVTVLELDGPAKSFAWMLELSRLVRDASGDQDEVARTERRLARIGRAAAPGSELAATLDGLGHALALLRAFGGKTESIGRHLRAATYLAGSQGDPGSIARDPRDGQAFAACAHAVTVASLAATLPPVVNPVLVQFPGGATTDRLAQICARLDPGRAEGQLMIRAGPQPPMSPASLLAHAGALHRAGHHPAWLYGWPVADGAALARLRAVTDLLGDKDVPMAGVSLTLTGRYLEHVTRIAGALAGRDTAQGVASPASARGA